MSTLNTVYPKLSIIIPNYNHGALLGGILSDVTAQEYNSYEVVIVDDGSTDNSIQVIESWQSKNSNIVLIKNEKNRGVIYSLNRAITESRGEYLAFPSADNRIDKCLYSKSIQMLDDNPKAALCFSNPAQFEGETEKIIEADLKIAREPRYFSPEEMIGLGFKRISVGNMSHTIVVRKKTFEECREGVEYFVAELGPYCDFFAWNVLAFRYGACFIPESLAFFRIDKHSYSAKHRDTTKATVALLDTLTSPKYLDVRDKFKRSAVLLSVGWNCFRYISKHSTYRCLMGLRYFFVSIALRVKSIIPTEIVKANG